MAGRFQDRVVVVTGGTGALGSAVVARILDEGGRVWVPCFHLSEMSRFPHRDSPSVKLVAGVDLRAEAAVEGFYEEVVRGAGAPGLWASIHVAGAFAMAPFGETTRAMMVEQFELNALSAMVCCREAVRAIRRAGRGGGRIVNVSALAGVRDAVGGMVAYTSAKAAVAALTRGLAEEVRREGILVNAIAPGVMDTPANRAAMPDADPKGWASVVDVASAICWLASPDNAVSSGAVVPVFGPG